MKTSKLNKVETILRSVFTKLVLISLATWLCLVIALVSTFVLLKKGPPGLFHKNFSTYFQYIIDDIGSPPDREKALLLSRATGIEITYTSPGSRWTTRQNYPDIDSIHFRSFHDSATLEIARKHGRHLLRQLTDDGALLFEFTGMEDDDSRHAKSHLLLLFLFSFILLGGYLGIKRVLAPLKWLNTGVQEVAAGNLDHRVPVKGKDELGELGRGFNEMTTKLKEMIASKEHLLRDVSHDLRSPLTRIRVALELIEDKENREGIGQDIEQMENMISAILDAARVGHESYRLDKVTCDLDEIICSVTARYKNMGPGLEYFSPAQPIYCPVDTKGFKTVLTNLVDNGLKFSRHSTVPVQINLTREGTHAIITVTDHGRGIEEEDLPSIFDPFFRADKSRAHSSGFGLGLSLCQAIIEAHGGTIEAQSTPGAITQMTVTLPLSL